MRPGLLLGVLAVVGGAGLLFGAGRSLLGGLRSLAELLVEDELERVRRARGDLTGMAEAARRRTAWRRDFLRDCAEAMIWLGLLVGPALLGWGARAYAIASLGWVIHWRRGIKSR